MNSKTTYLLSALTLMTINVFAEAKIKDYFLDKNNLSDTVEVVAESCLNNSQKIEIDPSGDVSMQVLKKLVGMDFFKIEKIEHTKSVVTAQHGVEEPYAGDVLRRVYLVKTPLKNNSSHKIIRKVSIEQFTQGGYTTSTAKVPSQLTGIHVEQELLNYKTNTEISELVMPECEKLSFTSKQY